MMLNPVVAMLKNHTTGCWHPILFREAPFPGDPSGDSSPRRLRSKGHHGAGFDSREAAIETANSWASQISARCALDQDIAWDGIELPAMNILYTVENGDVKLLC